MDLKKFREQNGLSRKEVITFLHQSYPGYGYPTNSMAESPEHYGVRLTPEAETLLNKQWPLEGEKAPKKDRHRAKHKMSFRTSKAFASRFIKALALSHYKSAQDALYHITLEWIKKQEEMLNV